MRRIVQVEMDERTLREWVAGWRWALRGSGQSLRVYQRTLSVAGLSTLVWIAVLFDNQGKVRKWPGGVDKQSSCC